ncbi:MAG: hypothetical protein E6J90_42855 [Deltaproteobacteria bacterium]|nr:MAG: hypothetical protein E6J90_42855 [Deltaproteobacteria bacterium]
MSSLHDGFISVIEARDPGDDLVAWITRQQHVLEPTLVEHGGILLRGFSSDRARFARAVDVISSARVDYTGGNSPRTEVADGIFTASELPSDFRIAMHHEMSIALCMPMKIFFFCEVPSSSGGETPLCSSRRMLRVIPAAIFETIERHGGVTYVRNFHPASPFKDVAATFGTTAPREIEAICRRDGIEAEWKGPDWLQTRQTRPAFWSHPRTGERVFTATIHIWHPYCWLRELRAFGAVGATVPAHDDEPWMYARYASGTAIDHTVAEAVAEAYEREQVSFPWRTGDVLVLDNLLTSHGRTPYSGTRRILVALREPRRMDSI